MSRANDLKGKVDEVRGRSCKQELKDKADVVLNHLRGKFKESQFSVNPVKSAGNGLPSFVRISIKQGSFFEDPLPALRKKFHELNFTLETRRNKGAKTSSILVSMATDNRPLKARVRK